MIRAAKKGKLEKIRKFVQMGADVNFINEEHQCAILKAAECGHKDAVDLLAVLGADMNFTDKRRSSILHYAAYNGHTHTVETIAKNASWLVNASNNFGYTPLQYAA
uniref:Ankyrin repeat protein n=1 Tax=Guillardia theta (strain CCMP2712) TaxID=905079 RepID=A0A0C3U4U6_GUITC